jgi:diguanylate cyclase (GGDEF)-like protein
MESGTIHLDGSGAGAAEPLIARPSHARPEVGRERRRTSPALGPPPTAVRVVYAVMAVLLLAYLIWEAIRRSADSLPLIDNWGVAAFELTGSLLCLARGLSGPDRSWSVRAVPLVLGAGTMVWSIGDFVVAGAGGAGTPLAANVVYLGFYPLTYVGVMLLLRLNVRRFTAETWLDGLIAGFGAAALSAVFLFHSVLHASGGDRAVVATNLAYPIGDLLLLALVIGGSAVLPGRRRLPWMMLAFGLGINTLGDTANLFASGLGATHLGAMLNAIAWPTSILLVSASVWVNPGAPATAAGPARPGFAFPALACLGCTAVLFVGSVDHISRAALILGVCALAAAGVRSALSVKALQRLTSERHRQAVTDQLTQLANRRALFELLETLEREHHANGGPRRQTACLFVDLNRFKEVNDSFGHSVGDELLRQLGQRLHGILRGSDLLARLGGDEFVVMLLDADGDYGAMAAQRISARLREPFQLGPVRASIGASIGIAVSPEDATDPSDLLRCADLAMYRAKVDGKPFAIYNEELDGRGNRMGLVEDLRVAIAERSLELHYQPQVTFDGGAIVALEALVRWDHPRLGQIPPLEFLPLAEDAELMDPLSELVLDMALEQCARWHAAGNEVSVCVNLSTSNLVNPELPALVQATLERHGLTPRALVLEVTETTAITDFSHSRETIARLRDLGIVVSVDDFGAGFTSLAYLSSLAVGELKLDRSFIQGLSGAPDARNQALIRSTIELAHGLGMRVVAEGIEDEPSFELLAEFGCDLAQGYLVSRPQPAEALDLSRSFQTLGLI